MSEKPKTSDFEQPVDEKPKRDQSYQDKPESRDNPQMRILGAIVLIGLGVIFLLKQYGVDIPLFANWWALFILIPAVGALWGGYTTYTHAGTWTSEARGAIGGGVFLLLIALTFLLQLDWGKIWPFFLIIPGVLLLFNIWGPSRRQY